MQLLRPVWADPRWLMSANDFQATVFSVVTPGDGLLAPADPTRWAIGFSVGRDFNGGFPIEVYPLGGTTIRGWNLNQTPLWFSIFTYGPMVCREWYFHTSFNYNITVYSALIM